MSMQVTKITEITAADAAGEADQDDVAAHIQPPRDDTDHVQSFIRQ